MCFVPTVEERIVGCGVPKAQVEPCGFLAVTEERARLYNHIHKVLSTATFPLNLNRSRQTDWVNNQLSIHTSDPLSTKGLEKVRRAISSVPIEGAEKQLKIRLSEERSGVQCTASYYTKFSS